MNSHTVVSEDKLPSGWAVTAVENLAASEPAAITDGPFGSNLKSDHYTADGPRVIRLQNIGDGIFLDAEAHISKEHFDSLRKHEARADDVVIAMLGEQLPRACLVPATLGPAIVKADCVRLRVHPEVAVPSFVVAGLNSQALRRQAAELMHGVGRPRLGLQWFRGLHFPVAPRAEQQRIVEAIESYFTRLDDAVATLERVERNLKRYRASVLKAAVEGRLVPTEAALATQEGRAYEPASVLLERILTERRRRWSESGKKGTYQEPSPPDTTNLPDLPDGWCYASLEALTSPTRVICYGILMPKEHLPGGVPYVKVRDMRSGTLDVAKLQRTAPEISAKFPRSVLVSGDLLLAIRGTYGRVVEVPPELEGGNITQDSARLDLMPGADRRYVKSALLSSPVQNYFKRVARGVAVKGVNIAQIRPTPIALPPLAEQQRIADQVEDLLSIAEASLATVIANVGRCSRLRQAVLKWAFEGKLADQDSNDEPASVLLERIKTERATPKPAKTPRPQHTAAKAAKAAKRIRA